MPPAPASGVARRPSLRSADRPERRNPAFCVIALAVVAAGCAESPLGREQLILFPDEEVEAMGVAAFRELKASTPRNENAEVNAYVGCVADAITATLEDDARGEWEVTVFADDQVNAFALPGRKIGVYQGLLSVAENQHQLATVLGHEVAHVLARHSNERISTQFAAQAGLDLVGAIAGGGGSATRQTLFGLLGLGTQVGVLLPFSRKQESEADLLGLRLLAQAGFEPEESISLWHNMIAAGGEGPPEFLSTHPSGETRIEALEAAMPEARKTAAEARESGRTPDCAP